MADEILECLAITALKLWVMLMDGSAHRIAPLQVSKRLTPQFSREDDRPLIRPYGFVDILTA